MESIGLVAPDRSSFEEAQRIIEERGESVVLAEGLQEKGVAEAAKMVRQGIDVIISRGETAKAIKAAFPGITVVTIQRSGFDIVRALGKAKQYGGRIAVIVFPYIVKRIASVCDALGIKVAFYPLYDRSFANTLVNSAVADGAAVIIGAVSVEQKARELGIPYELVHSGPESLTEALDEAAAILRVRHADKAAISFQQAVMNSTEEGIIAVDSSEKITLLNAMAERLLGVDDKKTIGLPLEIVWPELAAENILAKDETNLLISIGSAPMVCTLSSVFVEGESKGAVCVFHDANRLQAMEAALRRKLTTSGHVAVTRFHDIQGKSPALRQAVHIAKQYARSEDTILLTGETGTGKELFAQSIHNHSARCKGPFVAVNCAALPGSLLESELFGYTAGAFTGASSKGKAGLFELAHGGTVFLDEITEADPATQAKLLRVLQEKKVTRLGSDQVIAVDVRIIAATNKNLAEMVSSPSFRRDLYYRLTVLLLMLPPLRERPEDIPLLANYFLGKRTSAGKPLVRLTQDAYAMLKAYSWPGNIRELQNVMARVTATGRGELVDGMTIVRFLDPVDEIPANPVADDLCTDIIQALRDARGRRGLAAQRLGISRSTLWRKMRKLHISA